MEGRVGKRDMGKGDDEVEGEGPVCVGREGEGRSFATHRVDMLVLGGGGGRAFHCYRRRESHMRKGRRGRETTAEERRKTLTEVGSPVSFLWKGGACVKGPEVCYGGQSVNALLLWQSLPRGKRAIERERERDRTGEGKWRERPTSRVDTKAGTR